MIDVLLFSNSSHYLEHLVGGHIIWYCKSVHLIGVLPISNSGHYLEHLIGVLPISNSGHYLEHLMVVIESEIVRPFI